MRFARQFTVVAMASVWLMIAGAGGAGARGAASSPSARHVGPVTRDLLRFLSSQGPAFVRAAGRSAPAVTRSAAIADALRDGQWHPVAARGISLVRTTRRAGQVPRGTLAWLVSVEPRRPVYDGPADPPANFVVVLISAADGHLLGDMAGYRSVSGRRRGATWSEGEWASAPRSPASSSRMRRAGTPA